MEWGDIRNLLGLYTGGGGLFLDEGLYSKNCGIIFESC